MTITSTLIESRPDKLMDDMPKGSTHWRVRLRNKNRQMTIYWSQGPAICGEPKLKDVLEVLESDASSAGQDFESWCDDYGYSTDSRKAERIYKATVKQAQAFNRLRAA